MWRYLFKKIAWYSLHSIQHNDTQLTTNSKAREIFFYLLFKFYGGIIFRGRIAIAGPGLWFTMSGINVAIFFCKPQFVRMVLANYFDEERKTHDASLDQQRNVHYSSQKVHWSLILNLIGRSRWLRVARNNPRYVQPTLELRQAQLLLKFCYGSLEFEKENELLRLLFLGNRRHQSTSDTSRNVLCYAPQQSSR